MKTYLVELLMKQDQMSMAASIESRVPFLDHQLVEFVATLPDANETARADHQVDSATSGEGHPAARDSHAAEDGLSGAIFVVDAGAVGERGSRRALRSAQPRAGLVNHRALGELMQAHAAGTASAGDAIWALLNLELWYRTFVDGGGIQTLSTPSADARLSHDAALTATA